MKLPILVQAHPETKAVITMKTITNKETGEEREVGNIMVKQNVIGNLSGVGRLGKRVAFITLEKEVVDLLRPMITVNAPFPVDGKICVEETLVPYIKSDGTQQSPKVHGKTGAMMTYQGQPIYRNTFFTEVMSTQDILLRDASDETADETPE
tara:strand:- start:466 stop:921 length:456 start_codon:yes stop_codon:yes gene_type:complete